MRHRKRSKPSSRPDLAKEGKKDLGQRLAEEAGSLDPAAGRLYTRRAYLEAIGAFVLARQNRELIPDATRQASCGFIAALMESMRPRDVVEEMLVLQLAWCHARVMRLSALANQETDLDCIRGMNEACDRAANTFRKLMLGLAEYRRPPRSDAVLAIQQANIANQQVVQNVSGKSQTASNEQGSAPPAIPPQPEWLERTAADGRGEPPLAVEHGPEDA